MSLFDLLYLQVRITGLIRVQDLDLIGTDSVYTTTPNLPIPFSLSNLPDIVVPTSNPQAGNTLSGSTSPNPVNFTLPTIVQVINSGGDLDGPYTVRIPDPGADPPVPPITFALPNTANEFLAGFGGGDIINGLDGDDVLLGDGLTPNEGGTDGADILNGGLGNDVLIGGGGNGDLLNGNDGNDFILGDYFLGLVSANIPINVNRRVYQDGGGGDFLGSGASFTARLDISYSASIQFGSGNEGTDTINGGAGNDIILADRGNDTANGDAGDDTILGGSGSDAVSGGDGADALFGDSLAPNFYGPDGSDTLNGNAGNDLLVGGGLGDTLNGGDGDDILLGDYLLQFFSGQIRLDSPQTVINIPSNIPPIIPEDTTQPTNIAVQIFSVPAILPIGSGNEGNDILNGDAGNDIAFADRGNDTINLGTGNDIGFGLGGSDIINGGADNDVIFGDFTAPNFQAFAVGTSPASPDGADILRGDAGDDFIVGGGAGDTIEGGLGNDVVLGDYWLGLFEANIPLNLGQLPAGFSAISSLPIGSGLEGNDNISGGAGDDILIADRGFDSVDGDEGNDFVLGGADGDSIFGGTGADILIGDLLSPNAYGSDGADFIDGEAGDDVIVGGGLGDSLFGGSGNDFILGDYWASLPINSPFAIPLGGPVDGPVFTDSLVSFSLFSSNDIAISDAVLQLPQQILLFIGSGNEGNDFIDAGAGDDFAFGDRGEDTVLGRDGNDILLGGAQDDVLRGGSGDDVISGDYVLPQGTEIPLSPDVQESLAGFLNLNENGSITIDIGPAGDDLLEGGAGNDILLGDEGNDTATYENDPAGVNISLGSIFDPGVGSGFDGYFNFDTLISIENLIGSQFNDVLNGDANDNKIWGRKGDDQITGGGGNDMLYGEEGNDSISGGFGDDFIVGGKGGDFIDGGFGIDTSSYRESDFGVVVDLDVFFGIGFGYSGDARGDVLINIENLEGSDYVDQLWGNSGNNKIEGFLGDDQIFGRAGNDTLDGGEGNDVIRGGDGDDILIGQSGRDNLLGEAGNDILYGGDDFDELTGAEGDDRLFGEDGTDRLFGGEGNDQLFGGADNDYIEGNAGIDYLSGGLGDDKLLGQDGNDVIDGDGGNDFIEGGAGNDVITGGDGVDQMFGGSGRDLFRFSGPSPIIFDREDFSNFSTFESSFAFEIEQPNIPFVRPGTIDTIYDFEKNPYWFDAIFQTNDKIGLADGLAFEDLQFFGVISDVNSQSVDSTIISINFGDNEAAPMVHVLGLTPDQFSASDFVTV